MNKEFLEARKAENERLEALKFVYQYGNSFHTSRNGELTNEALTNWLQSVLYSSIVNQNVVTVRHRGQITKTIHFTIDSKDNAIDDKVLLVA